MPVSCRALPLHVEQAARIGADLDEIDSLIHRRRPREQPAGGHVQGRQPAEFGWKQATSKD
jgi:hypothetical protein